VAACCRATELARRFRHGDLFLQALTGVHDDGPGRHPGVGCGCLWRLMSCGSGLLVISKVSNVHAPSLYTGRAEFSGRDKCATPPIMLALQHAFQGDSRRIRVFVAECESGVIGRSFLPQNGFNCAA